MPILASPCKSFLIEGDKMQNIVDFFGENVFSIKTMRDYLSGNAYKSLTATIREGRSLNLDVADEVAEAMKTWAMSKGATHFTHWFQPLTGTTAEKHDSFIVPDREGGVLLQFCGKELTKGEPDASSFPSGGLRATFEARGYTAWDPTSPAFIKEGDNGATLYIPTAFYSYHGEALDKKTPLLRSIQALSTQVCRLGKLFGISANTIRAFAELGVEQEYFLIDRDLYKRRLDILQTGRTLFGRAPAKHQQMADHYFGSIKRRVLAFMEDLDRELWRLGIPAKTRHNEVCPAQFEIAPVFEELNLAVDHNMIMMEVMCDIAEHHGFACLLHEKPFAGVNGSGKHMNWSICGPDGRNWLKPGDDHDDDTRFLTLICTVLKAVDTHADILRASVATAGNDHRLGGYEAPPAIISIFLGEQLTDLIEQIEKGSLKSTKEDGILNIGVLSVPPLPQDSTDRNRTSPFAFTGNKFEFRAVGSSQSCADANTVLNTIIAEALDEICTQVEVDMESGKALENSLLSILQEIVAKHKRVIFNGDNYTQAWQKEAEKRQLPKLKKTPEALKTLIDRKTVAMFDKYGVLSERELKSRYEVYQNAYDGIIDIEAKCTATVAKTMIAPAALKYQGELAGTIKAVEAVGGSDASASRELLREVCTETKNLLKGIKILEASIERGCSSERIMEMDALREAADNLESLLPLDLWPFPSYSDLMFLM